MLSTDEHKRSILDCGGGDPSSTDFLFKESELNTVEMEISRDFGDGGFMWSWEGENGIRYVERATLSIGFVDDKEGELGFLVWDPGS